MENDNGTPVATKAKPAPKTRGARSPREATVPGVSSPSAPGAVATAQPSEKVMPGNRTLTEEDVAAIAEQVKALILEELQLETGKTVWTWVKRVVIGTLIYVALIGAGVDKHVPVEIFKGTH